MAGTNEYQGWKARERGTQGGSLDRLGIGGFRNTVKPSGRTSRAASPGAAGSGDGGAGGFTGPNFGGAEDQIFEGTDEEWGVADSGHHAVAFDAGFFRVEAAVDIDLVESFDVLGNKGNGDHHSFLDALVAELVERLNERGFEPLSGSDSALEAENARCGPGPGHRADGHRSIRWTAPGACRRVRHRHGATL